ncbi:MAG: excisionase [Lachnospiraceae bacterium]|nr:excisionase [Lachnospiraceae bacterium]
MYNEDIPIWEKTNLTVEEAAAYSGIGRKKIRELARRDDANFTLFCGRKLLIKRKRFDEYIDHELVI